MWQVGGTCYDTKTQALQAKASEQSGAVVQQGGAAYVVTVTAVAEDGVQYSMHPLAGGAPVIAQVPQEPMPCNLLTLADGQAIGWAIAAGWISVYLIMSLLRAKDDS